MSHYLIAHIGHTTKSHEHILWWMPQGRGYTFCIEQAGLYDLKEAAAICETGICLAVAQADVQPIARTTPYFRKSDGSLAKLYDGGDLVVVANNKHAWDALMAARIHPEHRALKPTLIGAKARAIYLPSIQVTA